jgi:CMP-N-acetylneuraminic acid synthetase
MNVLGLIPARSGSKGLPGKNIVPLRGKPLLHYTCDAARSSNTLSRIVLTTDSVEIARVGRDAGVEAPFERPAVLSQDDTPSVDVALHAIGWLNEHERWHTDVLVLLQPTSPLRTADHIDEALRLLLQDAALDTVVSVLKVPHRFNPLSVMVEREGLLRPYVPDPVPFDRYRRQNLPTCYGRNGPAILATRSDWLLGHRNFYGGKVAPYYMSEVDSLDIDDELDLVLAAAALDFKDRLSGSTG